jgi:hypothetical protein
MRMRMRTRWPGMLLAGIALGNRRLGRAGWSFVSVRLVVEPAAARLPASFGEPGVGVDRGPARRQVLTLCPSSRMTRLPLEGSGPVREPAARRRTILPAPSLASLEDRAEPEAGTP